MRLIPALLAACAVSTDAAPDAVSDSADTAAPQADLPTGPGALPMEDVPRPGEFMVVVLPDTQVYADRFPETFDAQLKWVAEHAEAYNIVFVSHVGDIVEMADRTEEWEVATAAYQWIADPEIPHGFSVGGHDVSAWGGFPRPTDTSCSPFDRTDCGAVDYLEHFGPQHYEGKPWFLGASPSGQSSAQLVEVEGLKLLFVHLPQDTPRAEVDWAHEILDAHPGTLAHLITHRYLFDYRLTDVLPPPLNLIKAGRFNDATYLFGGQKLMYNTGLKADDLFDELVAAHPNIWSVHCGHVDAEFKQTSTNSAGLPVREILVDFQDMADGGGGWMRLLKYMPAKKQVEVFTLSATTGELRENGAGYDHSVDILDRYQGEAASQLELFGITEEQVQELLTKARTDTPERQEYYDSLYGAGDRDSHFVLDVDIQAYVDAAK